MKTNLFASMFLAAVSCAATCDAAEPETVAVIGTGDMGDTLGPRFAGLGYRVIYGSRDPQSDKVQGLVARTRNAASAATPAKAAAEADIVVLAIPWPAMETVAQTLGNLEGKIVIDISMPFKQGEDGYPEPLLQTSSAQMIQKWNPGARVVKTFATMGSGIIDEPRSAGGTISLPIASDDKAAKEKVAGIVKAMGLDPVDFGPLRMAREIETLQQIGKALRFFAAVVPLVAAPRLRAGPATTCSAARCLPFRSHPPLRDDPSRSRGDRPSNS
jgi:hypothetical protein